jgi:hypothetical protein
MNRERLTHLTVAAIVIAATFTASSMAEVTFERWRGRAALPSPIPNIKSKTSKQTRPAPRERRTEVSIERQRLAEHSQQVQWGICGAGGLIVLRQLRVALAAAGNRGLSKAGNGTILEKPLIIWAKGIAWTVRDSFAGLFVCGANGSGKSTGSGRAVAMAFLRADYGGLVFTAKAEEVEVWRDYCRQADRESDLLVLAPGEQWRFDPIDYEWNHPGNGAGQTECVVQLLATVLEMADRSGGQGGGRGDEQYWRRAVLQLIRNGIDALGLARGRISIPDLYRLVTSAATSAEQMRSAEWRNSSFCFRCLSEADGQSKSASQARDFELVADYFLVEYPNLSEKTRSVIVSSFTSLIDSLNRGLLRELFCSGTNLTPEDIEQGKIVVIALPVKEFAEVGQYAQVMMKHCFQRAIERRNVSKSPRPVFFFADEAQYFVTAGDMQFLTTCRSARVANVYLTQNVNNLYAALGSGPQGKAQADSILACLNTKIFHSNSCPISNEMASTLIGRTRQFFVNGSTSSQGDWVGQTFGLGSQAQSSGGVSEHIEFEVQPSEFTSLRTGGPENRLEVDAIVFQNGKVFADTGRTWRRAVFRQTF